MSMAHTMMDSFSLETAENTDNFVIDVTDQAEVKGDSIREFTQALDRDQTSVSNSSVLLFPAKQLGMVAVHSSG